MAPTLQRSTSAYYNPNYQYTSVQTKENEENKMRGSWRVITFCLLTTILPSILIILPLYLQNVRYANVMYRISDSDVIQIHKGQSSIFCEKHSLKMDSFFNAFQMRGRPEVSDKRRHIKLKKSMTLPDATLEYWGFYLFNGATVELKACSQYEGSKILVVKGKRIFDTCGILEGDKVTKGTPMLRNQGEVLVTLEKPHNTSEIVSRKKMVSKEKVKTLKQIYYPDDNSLKDTRRKRDTNYDVNPPLHNPNTILDAGVNHGGNSLINNSTAQDNIVSSFETKLHECYHNDMVINEFIPHSAQCNSTKYLEITTVLKVIHNVSLDGYYYYIFYSANGHVNNEIHAIFDIYKPTFQYTNSSDSKSCINQTECQFNVTFLSDESVVVEVPTKNGLKNDDSDSSVLTSVCHPRVAIYIFFPIAVLLLILIFAFL